MSHIASGMRHLRACPESIFMIPMASGEPSIEIKARRP